VSALLHLQKYNQVLRELLSYKTHFLIRFSDL
jgi:hypothetical protein